VANFIGQANILEVEVSAGEGPAAKVKLQGGLELSLAPGALAPGTQRALISIRPEKIFIRKSREAADNCFEAQVVEEIFKGATDQMLLRTESGLELWAVVANESARQESVHRGEKVFCHLHRDDIVLLQGA
jgi:spermidine/putrescine transport system ATP-binding protein